MQRELERERLQKENLESDIQLLLSSLDSTPDMLDTALSAAGKRLSEYNTRELPCLAPARPDMRPSCICIPAPYTRNLT